MDEQQELLECTLSVPQLVDRRAAWEDLAPELVDRAWTADGFRVSFRSRPPVRRSLTALVEAEEDCCGWASWELADEGDHVVLQVTGPPQEVAALAGLFGL